MSGIEIIILIISVIIIAALIGAFMNYGQPSKESFMEEVKPEEFKEKFQPRKVTVQTPTRQVNEAVKEAVGITESKVEGTTPKKKRKYYPKKK